jgi:hypothetical protein
MTGGIGIICWLVGFELFDLAATFVAPNVFDLIISYPYDFVVEIRDAFLIRGDDG